MSADIAPTRVPIGVLSGFYAAFSLALVIASAWVAGQYESLLVRSFLDRGFGLRIGVATGTAILVELVLGGLVLRRHLRRARRSVGRGRYVALSGAGIGHALASIAAASLALRHARAQDLLSGFGLTLSASDTALVTACGVISASCGAVLLAAALSTWSLLSSTARARVWLVVDALLLAGAGVAIALLPAEPPSSSPHDLWQPIVRHVITTAFALRVLVRALPPMMNLIERIGFQPLVAARHLRSKKSGFLAAISLLSILAVTVSSCALTTTLSVMGGFRNDLKRKILGNNAHIVIDRDHASIEGWAPLVKTALETEGVSGASPYVSGEVMLSSATNLGTAVLRGVEPETVGSVNDLPRNLKTGSLDYLDHPEKLLDLPPDTTSSMFQASSKLLRDADAKTGAAGSAADAPAPTTTTADQQAADLDKKLKDLDAFLRKDKPSSSEPKNRDILPGIIVGQELARSLRLYLGDEVNVVAPLGALGPSGPMPKARAFRVAGIFYSGMYEYDMKFTYVSLATAQRFLNVGHAISGVEVKVKNVDNAPLIANSLRKRLGQGDISAKQASSLRVRDWQELNSRLFGALALEKLAMFIALGIAILVASFCIAGTLTLMVQEKRSEVAILKAMGASDRTIVSVFVIEGGLIGLLGSALGMFLGYMMCFAAEHFGIRMNPEVYYIDRLPVHMDPMEFTLTGLAAIAVCLLVTIYPALIASQLRPADALRYE